MAKILDANFFPSSMLKDMSAVVDQEIEALDPSAFPFFISKLSDVSASGDAQGIANSINFLLALAARKDPKIRESPIKKLIDQKSSHDSNAEFFTMLISQDPLLLAEVRHGTLLRLRNLLVKNMEKMRLEQYLLSNFGILPILSAILSSLGEDVVYDKVKDFAEAVTNEGPALPPFMAGIANYPKTFAAVFERFVKKASSADYNTANAFAAALPPLDDNLAAAVTDQQAFRLLSGIVYAANGGAWGSHALTNSKFASVPKLKMKAAAYLAADGSGATTIFVAAHVQETTSSFHGKYLSP